MISSLSSLFNKLSNLESPSPSIKSILSLSSLFSSLFSSSSSKLNEYFNWSSFFSLTLTFSFLSSLSLSISSFSLMPSKLLLLKVSYFFPNLLFNKVFLIFSGWFLLRKSSYKLFRSKCDLLFVFLIAVILKLLL